jgi:hypothetical protein
MHTRSILLTDSANKKRGEEYAPDGMVKVGDPALQQVMLTILMIDVPLVRQELKKCFRDHLDPDVLTVTTYISGSFIQLTEAVSSMATKV